MVAAGVRRAASRLTRLDKLSMTTGENMTGTFGGQDGAPCGGTRPTPIRNRGGQRQAGAGRAPQGQSGVEPPHSRAERRGGPPRPTYDMRKEKLPNVAAGIRRAACRHHVEPRKEFGVNVARTSLSKIDNFAGRGGAVVV